MKLQQKLAMVLAATMVATAVPVVTSAATTASVNTQVMVKGEKEEVTLNIKNDGPDINGEVEFIIEGQDIKFSEEYYQDEVKMNSVKYAIKWEDENTLHVTATPETATAKTDTDSQRLVNAGGFLQIPLEIEVTGQDPKVTVKGFDGVVDTETISLIGDNKVVDYGIEVVLKEEGKLNAQAEGKLGTIEINELKAGELPDEVSYKIQLKNDDLVFDLENLGDTLDEKYFEGAQKVQVTVEDEEAKKAKETKEIILTVVKKENETMPASVEIKNLPVKLEERKGSIEGTIEVVVEEVKKENNKFVKTGNIYEKFEIAKVVDEEVMIEVEESAELIAGQEAKEVRLKLSETVDGVIDRDEDFYLAINNGQIVDDSLEVYNGDEKASNVEFKIIGTEMVLNLSELTENLEDLTIKFDVETKVGQTGDVTITVDSKNLSEDQELVVAKSTPAFEVEYQEIEVEAGLKEQVAEGKIVITELAEDMLKDGKEIVVSLEGEENKISGATVTAEGMEVSKDFKNGNIIITIDEESREEAGTITIEDLQVQVGAEALVGEYDLTIGGNAVDFKNNKYTIENYLYVGNGTTEKPLEAKVNFSNGEAVVNGEVKEMTSAPFISENERTMMGIRDLATFFNIDSDDIIFMEGGQVTILNGEDIITLTNGENVIKKNGQEIQMDETMQIVDGRAYAPMKFIAIALGVDVEWDGATNTATFKN